MRYLVDRSSSANVMSSSKLITGPQGFQGVWYLMGVNAILADNSKEMTHKAVFVEQMRNLSNVFICQRECAPHFRRFIEKYPLEEYYNVHQGFFLWVWAFHNEVNQRKGKPLITFEQAKKLFDIKCNNCLAYNA